MALWWDDIWDLGSISGTESGANSMADTMSDVIYMYIGMRHNDLLHYSVVYYALHRAVTALTQLDFVQLTLISQRLVYVLSLHRLSPDTV
jgi:hypothetical protein